ncbi:MAG: hypothetical protein AUJ72_01170 [Candidatus Omnitrophica bacterium CG1_02_46_14]|nr:MAG: hypothetical protein AUJ72_01170 [Candidatus Omnitrophica bacterium CG1_02_46_14]
MGDIDSKIFALNEGEITTPVPTALGYHIFKAVERQRTSVKPLSEVRPDVQDLIFREKLKDRLNAWLGNLKKNAYISIR